MRWCFLASFLATVTVLGGEGQELIGKPAPELNLDHWQNSRPLQLKDLRGKVVLIRWWTAPDCPYCASTAPALNAFYRRYRQEGLEVIGAYHHKAHEPLSPAQVEAHAQKFGFKFPVGIDTDWKTLDAWWLHGGDRRWTSVTFLLDRRGLIRFVHPGGQFVEGDTEHVALKTAIETALKEK